MGTGETESGSEHPFTAGRSLKEVPREPIITLARGRDYQKSIIVRIIPLEEPQPGRDPFIVINIKTGREVQLQRKGERLRAYRALRLNPTNNLVEGLRIHGKIKARKTKKVEPRDQSLITTY